MRKNRKNILIGASVLLVALFMVPSAAAATTITNNVQATGTCFENYVEVENEYTENPCIKTGVLWNNGPFDDTQIRGNTKGMNTFFGQNDLQVADDFQVPSPGWLVSDGHMEGLCFFVNLQIDYITVEFFEDDGTGLPKEIPFYTENSYSFTESDYVDANWPDWYYVEIDVNFGPVPLDPGTYWVKMQPYGCPNDWFYQGCTTVGWGNPLALRDGPWGTGWGHTNWLHDLLGANANFQLTGDVLVPDLQCTGALSWSSVTANSVVTGSFTVENIGISESKLDWAVTSWPGWGTWTFAPQNGNDLKPADGLVTVQVSVIAPDEKEQTFSGAIEITNIHDTSDKETILVSLTTPKNKIVNRPVLQFLEHFLDRSPLLARLLNL